MARETATEGLAATARGYMAVGCGDVVPDGLSRSAFKADRDAGE